MMDLENILPKLYTPYQKGKYSVTPGFNDLKIDLESNDYDKRVFQIDNQFYDYRKNKENCRSEIKKYYQEQNLLKATSDYINKYIIDSLVKTYPEYFSLSENAGEFIFQANLTNEKIIFDSDYNLKFNEKYLSLFDALCSQIQEDIVICQFEEKKDYLTAIHLCSPSYWSAEDKIGMNFASTHEYVAGMEKMLIRYRPLLESIFKKGPYYRFAWEINADKELNHHPEKISFEKKFDLNNPELYTRVERQTVSGFEEINVLLFTIRTYYTDVKKLSSDFLIGLKNSLLSMSEATLDYKRITEQELNDITNWLTELSLINDSK